ncbi:hypothetical protein DEU56DRAFT_188764 [Suillus clintonianus]|uniref:uncharacterized protein n=1 Tax=Suillus clintonianus TaxID=1904413 RepID=UPI001B86846A|nr:uncharacterized protein DEU56DRAFT_188764 [Suillus clintonianus]KAG2114534.1 hypothetical protein DEU56DRAFT_188764 [Suillus clintonianus]
MFNRFERNIYLIMTGSLAIISIALTSIIFKEMFSRGNSQCFLNTRTPERQKKFTFMGDDFPESFVDVGKVKLVVEESVRFALDRPEANTEWLSTSPPGTGHVALGPDNRAFFVAMFHQLHCLRLFRTALVGQNHNAEGHAHHCLNYLRQWILCQADLTLEAGDFTTRDFEQHRVGATHVCRDWGEIYDSVAVNWQERQLAASSNSTT